MYVDLIRNIIIYSHQNKYFNHRCNPDDLLANFLFTLMSSSLDGGSPLWAFTRPTQAFPPLLCQSARHQVCHTIWGFLLFCRLERLVWRSFRHWHTYRKYMYPVIMPRTKWAVNAVKLNIARSISNNFLTMSNEWQYFSFHEL